MLPLGQVNHALPPAWKLIISWWTVNSLCRRLIQGTWQDQIARDGSSSSRHQYFRVFFPMKNTTPPPPHHTPQNVYLSEINIVVLAVVTVTRNASYRNASWNWENSHWSQRQNIQKDQVVWAWSHQLNSNVMESLPEEKRIVQAVGYHPFQRLPEFYDMALLSLKKHSSGYQVLRWASAVAHVRYDWTPSVNMDQTWMLHKTIC